MLPDYPQELTFAPGVEPAGKTIDKGWAGVACQTENGLQVAEFQRDGFVFRRLRPYEQWQQFVNAALRLWKMFQDIGKPAEIQRMGVRFINRISLPPKEVRIEDYLDLGNWSGRRRRT